MMRNKQIPSEAEIDKRLTAVGVIGFLALAGVFFLLSLYCLGPWIKSQMRSRTQTPQTVYNPPAHRQSEDTSDTHAEDQQPVDIEITEQAPEETTAEDQTQSADEGDNTITFTLEPEPAPKPSAAKPAEPEKPAPRKESPPRETATIEKPRASTERDHAAASSDRIYRVQAGTFTSRTNAETLRDDLKAKGYRPEIKTVQAQGRTLYRVQIGAYKTQADARELAKDLSDKGYTPTTISERAE